MRLYKLSFFLLLFIVTGYSSNYFFHEGAIDKRGGHYDAKEKTYHYHHGCDAHLHEEGKCEYDFKNCKRERPNDSTHDHVIAIDS
jgi:hypothetical protein